ncbi:hypothetical protein ACSBR2_036937 [Camellia fascicularis]
MSRFNEMCNLINNLVPISMEKEYAGDTNLMSQQHYYIVIVFLGEYIVIVIQMLYHKAISDEFYHLRSSPFPDDASPKWMNKGDNAWQLVAATLVGLQSVPGLIILYGGAVKKKWAVNSAFMALYAFACVLRMSFGDQLISIWGKENLALDQGYLLQQTFQGMFPNATMVFFQFVFAAITLILIAGALLGRMNFYAWMVFVPLWLTFSYTVGAYSIWCPHGFLAELGVIDYSGGYVIHLSSGVAGFTAAYWVGPRLTKDKERFPPNNILLIRPVNGSDSRRICQNPTRSD